MLSWVEDDLVVTFEDRVQPRMLVYSRRRRGDCPTCGQAWDFCICRPDDDERTYQDDGEERRY